MLYLKSAWATLPVWGSQPQMLLGPLSTSSFPSASVVLSVSGTSQSFHAPSFWRCIHNCPLLLLVNHHHDQSVSQQLPVSLEHEILQNLSSLVLNHFQWCILLGAGYYLCNICTIGPVCLYGSSASGLFFYSNDQSLCSYSTTLEPLCFGEAVYWPVVWRCCTLVRILHPMSATLGWLFVTYNNMYRTCIYIYFFVLWTGTDYFARKAKNDDGFFISRAFEYLFKHMYFWWVNLNHLRAFSLPHCWRACCLLGPPTSGAPVQLHSLCLHPWWCWLLLVLEGCVVPCLFCS